MSSNESTRHLHLYASSRHSSSFHFSCNAAVALSDYHYIPYLLHCSLNKSRVSTQAVRTVVLHRPLPGTCDLLSTVYQGPMFFDPSFDIPCLTHYLLLLQINEYGKAMLADTRTFLLCTTKSQGHASQAIILHSDQSRQTRRAEAPIRASSRSRSLACFFSASVPHLQLLFSLPLHFHNSLINLREGCHASKRRVLSRSGHQRKLPFAHLAHCSARSGRHVFVPLPVWTTVRAGDCVLRASAGLFPQP